MIYLLKGKEWYVNGKRTINPEWVILNAALDLESVNLQMAENIRQDEESGTIWEYAIETTAIHCESIDAQLKLREAINLEIAHNIRGVQ